jgi:hypothetical protein
MSVSYNRDARLPIRAESEDDATEVMLGRALKQGDNHLARDASGLELSVRATPGKPLHYRIVDADGAPVAETISVSVNDTAAKTTTCWECGKDAAGNTHCWKIPCPVITGPWDPDKVLEIGFVMR